MDAKSSLGLYVWYQQLGRKDLGVRRRDWLRHLREQAEQNTQNDSNQGYSTINDNGAITVEGVMQNLNEEEKKGRLEGAPDRLEQRQQQQLEDSWICASGPHNKSEFENCSFEKNGNVNMVESKPHDQIRLKDEGEPMSVQALASPLTSLLNTTLASPTLLLPQDGNASLEESRRSSLCSPTVPMCEGFSLGTRQGSPRSNILESLADNLDGSEVSWSSALATPTTHHAHTSCRTSPSTLERLTLHPRQGLRQNVLARTLFSPQTPGATSSSSGELSPGLGIIKCFSPVSKFNNDSTSGTSVRGSGSNEDLRPGWMDTGTQGFSVSVGGDSRDSCEKSITRLTHQETPHRDNGKPSPLQTANHQTPRANVQDMCSVIKPAQTSTPAHAHMRSSLKRRHTNQPRESPWFSEPVPLAPRSDKEKAVDTTTSPKEEKRHSSEAYDSDGCDDVKSIEDPFDIICSPVVDVKPSEVSDEDDHDIRLYKTGDVSCLSMNNEKGVPHDCANQFNERKASSERGEVHASKSVIPTALPTSLGILNCEEKEDDSTTKFKEKHLSGENSSSSLIGEIEKSEDSEAALLRKEELVTTEPYMTDKEGQIKGQLSPGRSASNSASPSLGKLATPLFKRTVTTNVSRDINREQGFLNLKTCKDIRELIVESTPKSTRSKGIDVLSLQKRKRSLGKFVYPTSSGEGYEELNVQYTRRIGEYEGMRTPVTPGSSTSPPAATHNTPTTPKFAGERCSMTNKQHHFLSLTNFSKNNNCETNIKPLAELVEPHKNVDETLSDNQEVPMNPKGILRTPPVASVSPWSRDSTGQNMFTTKPESDSLQTISVDSEILTIDPNNKHNEESRATRIVTEKLEQVVARPNAPPGTWRGYNIEAQCQTDLCDSQVVPELGAPGNLATTGAAACHPGNEERSKPAPSNTLNSQLMSDSFNDIDFSDSDFDPSAPTKEDIVTDKSIVVRLDNIDNQYVNCVDNVEQNAFHRHGAKNDVIQGDSGFPGFVTGSGRKVRVSEEALLQARKVLEEESLELHKHSSPRVSLELSDISNNPGELEVKGETDIIQSCSSVPSPFNQCNLPGESYLSPTRELHGVADGRNISRGCDEKKLISLAHVNNNPDVLVLPESVGEISRKDSGSDNCSVAGGSSQCQDHKASKSTNTEGKQLALNADESNMQQQETVRHFSPDSSESYGIVAGCVDSYLGNEGTENKVGLQGLVTVSNTEAKHGSETSRTAKVVQEKNSSSVGINNTGLQLKKATEPSNKPSTPNHMGGFQGFTTAAGSKVLVSKEAIRRAQLLWEESNDTDVDKKEPVMNNTGMSVIHCKYGKSAQAQTAQAHCLTTVTESKVIASQEPVGNSHLLSNKSNEVQNNEVGKIIDINTAHQRNTHALSSIHLQKASAPNENTRSVSQTISRDVTVKKNHDTYEANASKQNTSGSTTGNGSISSVPSSLREQSVMNSYAENLVSHSSQAKTKDSITALGSGIGFSTASGRTVSVSKASVDRAQLLWKESISSECSASLSPTAVQQEHKKSTGAGCHIDKVCLKEVVSPRRCQRARNTGCDEASAAHLIGTAKKPTLPSLFMGFSKAGGGKIVPSEASLIEARRLLEDDANSQPMTGSVTQKLFTQNPTDHKSYNKFTSEQDRKGVCHPVHMSSIKNNTKQGAVVNTSMEEHISGGLGKLHELEEKSSDLTGSVGLHDNVVGARDGVLERNYSIDHDNKTDLIIQNDGHIPDTCDIKEASSDLRNISHESGFCGFLTGNKKQVKVSIEALQQAKQLMQESPQGETSSLERSIMSSRSTSGDKGSSDKRQTATVKPFVVNTCQITIHSSGDQNYDENRCLSPILGSQKKCDRGRVVKYADTQVSAADSLSKAPQSNKMQHSEWNHSSTAQSQKDVIGNCDPAFSTFPYKKKSFEKIVPQMSSVHAALQDNSVADYHSQPCLQAENPEDMPVKPKRLCLPATFVENSAISEADTQKQTSCSANTQEISDISEITVAFLNDDFMDQEEPVKGSLHQRKRSRGSSQEVEEKGCTTVPKKQKIDICNQLTDNFQGCEEAEAARVLRRMKQEKLIKHKEKKSVPPVMGMLYKLRSERKQDRIKLGTLGSLKMFQRGRKDVLGVSYSNALQYCFEVQDQRCEGIECGDGCVVVPSPAGSVGVEEVEQGFLAMPGVHPRLIPASWVPNHYRMIVWHLAALERRLLSGQILTVEGVVKRLKYRYDREIDRAERPILRKITEQDDAPQKTMVLCVANVRGFGSAGAGSPGQHTPLLELTDGWYTVGAAVDGAMSQLVESGRVGVGTKLVLHGAELMGAPSPCHPLQAPSTLRLRLHTNMTRRARWWARLGLLQQRGPLASLFRETLGEGGQVGQMTMMVARLYPPVYYERSNSRARFHGEKAHLKILREAQKQKELVLEQVTEEVEKEFYQLAKEQDIKKGRQTMSRNEISGLTSGREISRLLEETVDPSSLEGLLSASQVQLAKTWQERQAEERKRKIHTEAERRLSERGTAPDATPLLKVRVVDSEGSGAMVTVWRPSEDLREALAEGSFFNVHYLMASGFRQGCRLFTATRQTRWERTAKGLAYWREEFARSATPLCLTTSGELRPQWQEVDLVGVVLRVGKAEPRCQIVHLVDHHLNILAVNFWGSLKECGYEDIVVEGSVLCLLNCSWRGHSGGRIGCVHFTELSAATCSPGSPYLIEAANHLRQTIKDMKRLLYEADLKLDGQFDKRAVPGENSPCGPRAAQETKPDSGENQPPNAMINNSSNSKVKRQVQQAAEVHNKLKVLGQYGAPGCLPSIPSPASLGARRPFRVPFKLQQGGHPSDAHKHT